MFAEQPQLRRVCSLEACPVKCNCIATLLNTIQYANNVTINSIKKQPLMIIPQKYEPNYQLEKEPCIKNHKTNKINQNVKGNNKEKSYWKRKRNL